MRRILAILAIIIAIPLLFIGMLMLVLANPEEFRDQISESVKNSTGYDLQINGEIKWRYWPPIAIEVTQIAIAIPGEDTPLASLDKAAIDLDLLPLLTGSQSIGVSGLSIAGLTLRPVVNKKGRGNWEIDTTGEKPEGTPKKQTTSTSRPDDSDSEGSSSGFQVHIAGINITDANIEYRDESTGDHYRLDIESLTTGSIEYDSPFTLQTRFKVEDLNQHISATGSLAGTLTTNSNFDQLSFENLELATTAQVPDIGAIDSTVTLAGNVNLGEDRLQITSGHLRLGDFQPSFSIILERLSSDRPKINGELEIPPFNPRVLMDQFQVEQPVTADANVLTRLSLKATLAGNVNRIELKEISAKLDSTQLNGSLIIATGNKLGITFALAMDEINASNYLEPDESDQTSASAAASNTTGQATDSPQDSEVIPVDLLAEYDISGSLSINKLHYDTYSFSDFVFDVTNRNGQLKSGVALKGYDGTITVDINSSRRGKTSTTIDVAVSDIDITKLAEAESITGTLSLTSNLAFEGAMMSQVMNTLDGSSQFNVENGTLDVTALKQLAAAIDAVQGKQSSMADWPDKMPFTLLTGNHRFNQGTVKNQKLDFKLENLTVDGKGGFDYFADRIDFDITVAMTESTNGRFDVSPSLVDVQWPIICKGSFDDPVSDLCGPDKKATKSLVADIARRELKTKGKSKLEKVIEEKAPEELKDLLKGLFRR